MCVSVSYNSGKYYLIELILRNVYILVKRLKYKPHERYSKSVFINLQLEIHVLILPVPNHHKYRSRVFSHYFRSEDLGFPSCCLNSNVGNTKSSLWDSTTSIKTRKIVDCLWNVMAHGDEREEKWRGNNRMEWVTSKRHVTAERRPARAVQTLQADVHSSPASSRLNWRPCRFKWTRPVRRKTNSGFCACSIIFQTQSTNNASCYLYKILCVCHRQTKLFCNLSDITGYLR
jgi:hypothetical protein